MRALSTGRNGVHRWSDRALMVLLAMLGMDGTVAGLRCGAMLVGGTAVKGT